MDTKINTNMNTNINTNTNMRTTVFFLFLLITGFTFAQVRIVETPNNTAALSSSAFIDASSHPTHNGTDNLGKGLLFPRTDLTAFSFLGVPFGLSTSYPTLFDGFVVYNTAASGTALIGATEGGALFEGFWYYDNKTGSLNAGIWKPMGSSAVAEVGSDDQNIANLAVNTTSNVLTVGIEDGTSQTVNLSHLDDSGTDDQNLTVAAGAADTSVIGIEGGTDAVTLTAGTGITLSEDIATRAITITGDSSTDDQNIANLAVNTTSNVLTVGIESGTSQTVDLSHLDDSGTDDQNLTVGSGLPTTSVIEMEGGTDIILAAGSGITLAESGNTITIEYEAPASSYKAVTGAYTLLAADDVIEYTGTSGVTFTLPSVATSANIPVGKRFYIVTSNTGQVSFDGTVPEFITIASNVIYARTAGIILHLGAGRYALINGF